MKKEILKYDIKSMGKDCKKFKSTCDYLEENITKENLRCNGGTLNYSGLTYDSDILLLASANGIPIGYNSIVRIENGYYIYQIAVRKDCQHKGVGTAMMKSVIDMAEEEKAIIAAHVRDYNAASKGMFAKLGFKKIEEDRIGNGLYILRQKRKIWGKGKNKESF